jgi:hypothetical protein
MVPNNATAGDKSSVRVTAWNACYNSGDGVIALSCTVSVNNSDSGISGVGLMLNTSEGVTLASGYTDLSNNNESVTPALNLPPGDLKVGDAVWGVVSGEADGQHYFFEQELTIVNC